MNKWCCVCAAKGAITLLFFLAWSPLSFSQDCGSSITVNGTTWSHVCGESGYVYAPASADCGGAFEEFWIDLSGSGGFGCGSGNAEIAAHDTSHGWGCFTLLCKSGGTWSTYSECGGESISSFNLGSCGECMGSDCSGSTPTPTPSPTEAPSSTPTPTIGLDQIDADIGVSNKLFVALLGFCFVAYGLSFVRP